MMYPMGGLYGMGWSMLLWFLLAAFVIAFLVVLVERVAGPASVAQRDAKRILDERLARGEIEPQEYRDRRELIG